MKTLLCLLWFMGSGYLLSAPENTPSPETIISEARIALQRLDAIHVELNKIFRKKSEEYHGNAGLTELEKKREMELYGERKACLNKTVKVAEMLKQGNLVFSYPGLIALSKIDFNPNKKSYIMRWVIGYQRYEDGEVRHPTYQILEFNSDGLITNLEKSSSVRRLTE